MLCGGGGSQRGSREGEARRSKHRSEQRERGAQQAARVLAAGALAVFAVDLQSVIYKRGAGALVVFTVDQRPATYSRATAALGVFTADPRSEFISNKPTFEHESSLHDGQVSPTSFGHHGAQFVV